MSFESHNCAISIEFVLSHIYKCDRFGFGGEIDADIIERNPIGAFKLGLAPCYIEANNIKRKQIDAFIQEIYQYENQRIEEIGIEKIEELTSKFKNLIK